MKVGTSVEACSCGRTRRLRVPLAREVSIASVDAFVTEP